MNHDRSINVENVKVSAATLADLLGVTSQTVTDRARRGVLSRDDDGLFLLRDAVRAYADELRQAAGRHGAGRKSPERERLLAAQAGAAELKLGKLRGELVPAVEVAARWSDVLRQVRAGVLAAPSRISARLGLSSADVEAVAAELRDVLEGLASAVPDSPVEREMSDEEFADAARALL